MFTHEVCIYGGGYRLVDDLEAALQMRERLEADGKQVLVYRSDCTEGPVQGPAQAVRS